MYNSFASCSSGRSLTLVERCWAARYARDPTSHTAAGYTNVGTGYQLASQQREPSFCGLITEDVGWPRCCHAQSAQRRSTPRIILKLHRGCNGSRMSLWDVLNGPVADGVEREPDWRVSRSNRLSGCGTMHSTSSTTDKTGNISCVCTVQFKISERTRSLETIKELNRSIKH